MFTPRIFEVDIVRKVDVAALAWPERGQAITDSGLGCNRAYVDLRRLPWREAKRVFSREGDLIKRIETSGDPEAEYEIIEEELWDDGGDFFGLDLGVASTVVCLSAAGCVPFASCNAGALGGHHHEASPVVAFYARPNGVELLMAAAVDAEIGLEDQGGYLIAYANRLSKLRDFAEALLNRRSYFNRNSLLRSQVERYVS